jgi:hypothetical protein
VTAGVGGAIKLFTSAIKAAFEFERYETQFKVLFGSLDKAKQRISELKEFAAATPFEFGEIAEASRKLHVFTNGVMGTTESLKLVGDAAAAIGAPIGELSTWVGRAYSAIKGGQPFGEAAQRLMELGVLTPEVRSKMEDLQEAGATNIEVWAELEQSLGRFGGGMKELSTTGEGLFSTLKDNWNQALAEFGQSFMDVAKGGIGDLANKLNELKENGDIAVWASNAKKALDTIRESLVVVGNGLSSIYKWSGLSDVVANIKGVSAAAGAVAGGDFKNAFRAYQEQAVQGNYQGMANAAAGDPLKLAAANSAAAATKAKDEANIREEAKKRIAAEKAAEKSGPQNDLKKDIAKDMAAAQLKVDEKLAKEKADKKAADWKKTIAEMEKFDKRADKAEGKIQKDQEEADHRAAIDKQRAGIQEQVEANNVNLDQQQGGVGAAESRLQKANAAAEQAWGWVNDPKAFKAQLASEKQQAKAEAKFEKDAERVKGLQDWRTRKLSDKDEAVRRMMLAKEDQQKAEDQLQQIQRHVANLEQIRKDLQKALNAAGG